MDTVAYNGQAPYQAHSAPSKQAAASVKRHIGPLHEMVIGALKLRPATDEQLCEALQLEGNTLRPRRRELQLMGVIKPSGSTAKTKSGRKAAVWMIAA